MAAGRGNNAGSGGGNADNEAAGGGGGDLRAGLARARKQEMQFGAVIGRQGSKMIAGKKPVKASEMKEMLVAAGGGKKMAGTCQFKDGELVLTLAKGKGPAGAEKELRRLIKEETGFSWKVSIVAAGEEGEEEDGSEA